MARPLLLVVITMNLRTSLSISFALVGLFSASAAEAAPLNDKACKPSAGKFPVVLVHGRGGDVNQMTRVVESLAGAGYCTYGMNYGKETGDGEFGLAHLDKSAAEIGAFIDGVLKDTGAKRVNVVGHSAGTGVIDNWIQLRGGAAKTYRSVAFGGLHHPYAHVGLANVIDGTLFLPNTILAVQNAVPPFTTNIKPKDVIAAAMGVAGGALSPADRRLVESGFVSDLFDPQYWLKLHGGLSENPGQFAALGTGQRNIKTKDAAPNVCYTNIVGLGDFITGTSAGFQDPAPNVENFTLQSAADHSALLTDNAALAKMVQSLNAPCLQAQIGTGNGTGPSGEQGGAGAEVDPATGEPVGEGRQPQTVRDELGVEPQGCSSTGSAPGTLAPFALAALGIAALRRRARPSRA